MFGENITFADGLLITALGMGVTFAALIALSFMLDLMKVLFYKEPTKAPVKVEPRPKAAPESPAPAKEDDEELVAVITAAVAASLNTSTHNIVVRNIVRLPDATPAWGRAGRIDQMNKML
ncbi:OadG family protein [Wukongibacter baidiensis]|uniref:OadG family protein n=1 Tax=Wukongibacter baidiensis TaxID=1723361 RepID=UPI003D7FB402